MILAFSKAGRAGDSCDSVMVRLLVKFVAHKASSCANIEVGSLDTLSLSTA